MARGILRPTMAGPHFEVRGIPGRPLKMGQRHSRTGVRLGPFATGEGANGTGTPPPVSRGVRVRGIADARSAAGQVGFPLSTSTDACLGCSVAGYQSSEVAFAWRDVRRSVQIRPMGQASRGYSGTKRGLAQRAKVGYCPCCGASFPRTSPSRCAEGSGGATM